MTPSDKSRISSAVFAAATEVHNSIGPGLNKEVYQKCFLIELRKHGLLAKENQVFPVYYKNIDINEHISADVLIQGGAVISLVNGENIAKRDVDFIQRLMEISSASIGIIVNFQCENLMDGFKKIIQKK